MPMQRIAPLQPEYSDSGSIHKLMSRVTCSQMKQVNEIRDPRQQSLAFSRILDSFFEEFLPALSVKDLLNCQTRISRLMPRPAQTKLVPPCFEPQLNALHVQMDAMFSAYTAKITSINQEVSQLAHQIGSK